MTRVPPPPPLPAKARTRWVWIPVEAGRVLAFTYVDATAGPSAKGRMVGNPPRPDQVRDATDHPDQTFRRPAAFGAIPIAAEEALRLGLPKEPPWFGHFDGRPVPPPRGQPSRTVTVWVRRDGRHAPGVSVCLGHVVGPEREFMRIDERLTDEMGRAEFPLAPLTPIAAMAHTPHEGSPLLPVPDTNALQLDLAAFGAIEGVVMRAGVPVRGRVSIMGRDGGRHRVRSSDASGRYRIEGVVPGRYDIEVNRIDPRTHMSIGKPVFDELVVIEGRTIVRHDVLTTGVTVQIMAAVENDRARARVYLFSGAREPRDSTQLRELWRGLDSSLWRSANTLTNDGRHLRCTFVDVEPGIYTVCVTPDRRGDSHDVQPVVSQGVFVGTSDAAVEIVVPPLRGR